jgi:phosphatidylglycerophosphatase A
VRKALLSGLGVGLVPGLPGTYASAVVAGAALALAAAGAAPLWACAAGAVVLGSVATLALAAPKDGEGADPSWVVTDEVAGQGVALLGAVPGGRDPLLFVALSFALFRVLDIAKPGLVARLERLPGAVGVLADDLAAGAGAAAATYLAASV